MCSIYRKSLTNGLKTVTLKAAGAKSVNAASQSGGLEISVVPGTVVHESCRRDFTNKKDIERTKKKTEKECASSVESHVEERSQCSSFQFARDCFFSGLRVSERS